MLSRFVLGGACTADIIRTLHDVRRCAGVSLPRLLISTFTFSFWGSAIKLHHFGIAVENLEQARENWESLLGAEFSETEIVRSQKVRVCFADVGDVGIELIQADSPHSPVFPMLEHPILSFIRRSGEGLHHLSFGVDDLDVELARLRAAGLKTLTSEPTIGADGARVIFLRPDDTGGVLIELTEVATR